MAVFRRRAGIARDTVCARARARVSATRTAFQRRDAARGPFLDFWASSARLQYGTRMYSRWKHGTRLIEGMKHLPLVRGAPLVLARRRGSPAAAPPSAARGGPLSTPALTTLPTGRSAQRKRHRVPPTPTARGVWMSLNEGDLASRRLDIPTSRQRDVRRVRPRPRSSPWPRPRRA